MKMSDPHDRKNILLLTDDTFCKLKQFFFWLFCLFVRLFVSFCFQKQLKVSQNFNVLEKM